MDEIEKLKAENDGLWKNVERLIKENRELREEVESLRSGWNNLIRTITDERKKHTEII